LCAKAQAAASVVDARLVAMTEAEGAEEVGIAVPRLRLMQRTCLQ